MRYVFFACVFFVTIPLFLKKSMDDLQLITVFYLLFLFLLILWIFVELPFFAMAYKSQKIDTEVHYWRSPSFDWPTKIFGLLIGFYV